MRNDEFLGCTDRNFVLNNRICFNPKKSYKFKEAINIKGNQKSQGDDYDSLSVKKDILDDVKTQIKNIDWNSISKNWTVKSRINQYSEYQTIKLNPYQSCSDTNPLYMHKKWVERIYFDDDINLNDNEIAKICKVSPSTIGRWRKRFQIPSKERGEGRWYDKRSGRIFVRVPKDYYHPQLKDDEIRRRGYRPEHIYKMEQYLSEHPELDESKKYLIKGKYLKRGCEVHHINFNPRDNRIENLWIYDNKKAHAEGELSLREILKLLIRMKKIIFQNGKYFLNRSFDYRHLSPQELLKRTTSEVKVKTIDFKNLDEVKKAIKNIDWREKSKDWTVIKYYQQYKREKISVNPYLDCSENNPLFMHKIWTEIVYNDKRFNMTDSRLANLCGISKDKARYWRDRVHKISGKKEWGWEKIIDKSDGRIWVRVPKSYKNPVVNKDDYHRRIMLEHRYVMEQYLAQHPDWLISQRCLIEGKYLKSECEVHHINLDYQDNRIENLWIFETNEDHQKARESLYSQVEELLNLKLIRFNKGKYFLSV